MHLLRRLILFTIVMVSLFPAVALAGPPDIHPSHLRISLFNDAAVPQELLERAETRASFVLGQAGIEVDWLICHSASPVDFSSKPTECSAIVWPQQLSVRILKQGKAVGEDTFGQSFLDQSGFGAYANIYFASLNASRAHPELSDGEMLGYVIAHEVGHLLLGANSHSDTGVMQARWRGPALHAAAQQALYFTSAQAVVLRSRLSNSYSLSASTRLPLNP